MIRPIALVSAGTLASRLTGFVRDAMLAALLGAGAAADAFLVAFQLVTLIRRLLTEGALNAAFVPAWLRVRDEHGDTEASAFAGRALGTIGLGVTLIAVIIGIVAPLVIAALAPGFIGRDVLGLAVTDARLMLPYLAFAGPVAVLIALANARRDVALSAVSPLLFNAALIAVMAVLLQNTLDALSAAYVIAATVGIAGLLQLAILAGSKRGAAPVRVAFDGEMRALLGRAIPGMVASAGPQMLMVAGAIVVSRAPSAVSWLYFASRLIDLPLGIVGTVAGAVLLPEMSHAVRGADRDAMRRTQAHGVGLAMALALPATAGLFVLAEPIVRIVFERGAFAAGDSSATANVLQMLALGLPAQALSKALAPSFYARHDTTRPMIATLSGLAVALIAGLVLFSLANVTGVAAALALGSWVTAATMLWCDGLTLKEMRLLRIALAALVMSAALFAVQRYVEPVTTVRLALLIATAVLLYGALLFATGAVRGDDLRGRIARGNGTPAARARDDDK